MSAGWWKHKPSNFDYFLTLNFVGSAVILNPGMVMSPSASTFPLPVADPKVHRNVPPGLTGPLCILRRVTSAVDSVGIVKVVFNPAGVTRKWGISN